MSQQTFVSPILATGRRFRRTLIGIGAVLACGAAAFMASTAAAGEQSKEEMIQDALKAAPPTLAEKVKIVDWKGNVLREGDATYTCLPTPPDTVGESPMCMDHTWMTWADAWVNKKPFQTDKAGIAYMLSGDTGASNVDPYAKGPAPDNQWILEGPHLMILVPDAAILEGISTDPQSGGPYVMWKGTPYAHIMIPVGERPAQTAAQQ